MKKTILLHTFAILITSILCVNAFGAPVTWVLENVVFEDGGTASGYFICQTDIPGLAYWFPDWEITMSGGDEAAFPEFTYNLSNSDWSVSSCIIEGKECLNFCFADREWRFISLIFLADITDAGGTVHLYKSAIYCGSWESYDSGPIGGPTRIVTSGYVVGTVPVTPELTVTGFESIYISKPTSKSPIYQIGTTVSPPGGSFKWEIIKGEDKIKFLSADEGNLADHMLIQGTAPSVVDGDVEIKVSYTVDALTATTSGHILVQKPSALTIVKKEPPVPYYDGYRTDYYFQVMDQLGNPLTSQLDYKEKRKKICTNYKKPNVRLASGGGETNINGVFIDELSIGLELPADWVQKVEQKNKIEGWDVGTRCQIYYSTDALSVEGPCGSCP